MAVMMLVPADQLVTSTSPFSDAAQAFGSWGPMLIAVGALISTAGAVNGNIFLLGQIPMSVALDKLAPPILAKRNQGQAPVFSLLLASSLGSICLLMNYTKGLLGMFTFLVLMSTSTFLIPILVCALAELKHSWRSARAWSSIAALTAIYSCFAILGSGVDVFIWGILLILAGLPLYYFGRRYQSN